MSILNRHLNENINFVYNDLALLDTDTPNSLQLYNNCSIYVKINDGSCDLTCISLGAHSEIQEISNSFIELGIIDQEKDMREGHFQFDFARPFYTVVAGKSALGLKIQCQICLLDYYIPTNTRNYHRDLPLFYRYHFQNNHNNVEKVTYQIYPTHSDIIAKIDLLAREDQSTLNLYYKILFKAATKSIAENKNEDAKTYLKLCHKVVDNINTEAFPTQIYMKSAIVNIKLELYQKAINNCDTILNHNPKDIDALIKRAVAFKLSTDGTLLQNQLFLNNLEAIVNLDQANNFATREIRKWSNKNNEYNAATDLLDLTLLYDNPYLSGDEIFAFTEQGI